MNTHFAYVVNNNKRNAETQRSKIRILSFGTRHSSAWQQINVDYTFHIIYCLRIRTKQYLLVKRLITQQLWLVSNNMLATFQVKLLHKPARKTAHKTNTVVHTMYISVIYNLRLLFQTQCPTEIVALVLVFDHLTTYLAQLECGIRWG